MREDIYGGLKNALERGASIEQAIKSFINAGYSSIEVREAANQVGGILPFIPAEQPSLETAQTTNQRLREMSKSSHQGNGKLIALIILLLLLLGALGATIFYREAIIEYIKGLL